MKHQRGLDYKYPYELQAFKLIPQASTDQHTQKVFMDLLTIYIMYIMSFNSKDKSTYLKLQWVNYINLHTYLKINLFYKRCFKTVCH